MTQREDEDETVRRCIQKQDVRRWRQREDEDKTVTQREDEDETVRR